MNNLIIGVDFDGTIATNKYPEVGSLRWFARPVLRWAERRGHTLILWTCREEKPLWDAIHALTVWGISMHYYNSNCPARVKHYGQDQRKLGYDVLIDDRASYVCWLLVPFRILWAEYKEKTRRVAR